MVTNLRVSRQFTSLELEILTHRLENADAIADVYRDTAAENGSDDERDAAYWSAFNMAETLLEVVKSGEPISKDDLCDLGKFVLADCVSGSVWVGCMIGVESDQKINSHYRAGSALAEKISRIVGYQVLFPKH